MNELDRENAELKEVVVELSRSDAPRRQFKKVLSLAEGPHAASTRLTRAAKLQVYHPILHRRFSRLML